MTTVSLVKPVSLIKRVSLVKPYYVLRERVSLVKPVRLDKRNPPVRRVRLYLSSPVLAFVDVVQMRDGTVWYAARRLSHAYPWAPRVVWTRVYRAFDVALKDRVNAERRFGCYRYGTAHDRMD